MHDIDLYLKKTSRTFALAVPLLPEPTRTDVALAYLLYRIADTIEDADGLQAEQKVSALAQFSEILADPHPHAVAAFARHWSACQPTNDIWCARLLRNLQMVVRELLRRDPVVSKQILLHARRTAAGMASYLRRETAVPLSLNDLQRYCYFVAGIVGELLTEIFAVRIPGLVLNRQWKRRAKAFGEGLQLVNIVRDSDDDAQHGRRFIPFTASRNDLYSLARQNLNEAERYVSDLETIGAEKGYLSFTKLPLKLAWATLDRVEQEGPGAKVSRAQLSQILAKVLLAGEVSSAVDPSTGLLLSS